MLEIVLHNGTRTDLEKKIYNTFNQMNTILHHWLKKISSFSSKYEQDWGWRGYWRPRPRASCCRPRERRLACRSSQPLGDRQRLDPRCGHAQHRAVNLAVVGHPPIASALFAAHDFYRRRFIVICAPRSWSISLTIFKSINSVIQHFKTEKRQFQE